MKNIRKSSLLILLCIFLTTGLFAQDWQSITPSFNPSGNYNLFMGTFVNENTGWAVSRCDRIWKTVDGGHNWSMQKDSLGIAFADIEFIDQQRGWISCYNESEQYSFLLRTIDGGNNWGNFWMPDTAKAGPFQVSFFDSLEGYAAGWNNQFYYTNDAGRTWQSISDDKNLFGFITDIFVYDSLIGWAVGEAYGAYDVGTIINTTGGKSNWEVNWPFTYELRAVHFINRFQGCAVGFSSYMNGVTMITNNGGESWNNKVMNSPILNDVVYVNDSTIWAIGNLGYIWSSQDSGKTWIQIESETQENLNRIVFVDNNRVGYIFGENSTLLKLIYDISSIEDDNLPTQSALSQNFPNPLNPTTTISYELPEAQNITLQIYDITGRLVKTLYSGYKEAGHWDVTWDASKQSSGVYIYSLQVGDRGISKKMVVLK